MQSRITRLSLLTLFLCFTVLSNAQSEIHKETEGIKLGAGIAIGHTWIPTAENSKGESEYVVVPSWALDFNLEFNERGGLILANEIQIQRFLVKTADEGTIERNFPFSSVLELSYQTPIGIGVYLGPGVELESHQNFFVFRLGIEYAIPINDNWYLKPSIAYEIKELEYSILNIGLGIGFLK